MATDKPTLEKFLSDPAFAADRALFEGVIDNRLKVLHEEAQKKKDSEEPKSIFDQIFGGK
jgi:hypothetical protein